MSYTIYMSTACNKHGLQFIFSNIKPGQVCAILNETISLITQSVFEDNLALKQNHWGHLGQSRKQNKPDGRQG